MQSLIDVFFSVLKKLEEGNVPYMVVGSVAAMVYGEPRLTRDMDLVIDVPVSDAEKLAGLFSEGEFYIPPVEVIRAEVVQRGQFNLLHQESGLKIDLMVRKNTEHALTEFSRRQKVPFWKGHEAFLACPEDVIIKKLDYYRQGGSAKHLTDIRGILAETKIDQNYLNKWIEGLGLDRAWKEI